VILIKVTEKNEKDNIISHQITTYPEMMGTLLIIISKMARYLLAYQFKITL
jgi:hypothetical protein